MSEKVQQEFPAYYTALCALVADRRIGAAELRGRKRCIDFGNAGGGGDHPGTGG